ncbi:hypothetical protein Pla163_29040 [Planctomycetes bacterium Pla163]|uniref:ABC-type transport auxiliary lipoprotein component domain-containing protein n=1 Tax=Rohdeia mirabilis TaxID=2528008 RepID=A0A518D2S1_9BACT|nr:hypothetical protein Pla163_29040 [Planctomycetes bacterium Pla163]
MRSDRTRPAVALVLALFASSCLSAPEPPKYRYLVLSTDTPSSAAPLELAHPVRLVEIGADDGARDVLTWQGPGARLERRALDRWAVAPTDHVRRLVLERLAPGGPAASARRLSIEIVAFGGSGAGSEARAQVELFATVEAADGTLVSARSYSAERLLDAGADPLDELCAQLGQISAELVTRVVTDAGS